MGIKLLVYKFLLTKFVIHEKNTSDFKIKML